MAPTRLIYASTRSDQSAAVLDAIFEVSRAYNLRDDITGALIVSDRHYLQLLEGDRRLIGQCMMRIAQDIRHTEIELIAVNLVPHRLFAQRSLHRIETSTLEGRTLKPFLIDGAFQPKLMPQLAIEDLCRVLSSGAD